MDQSCTEKKSTNRRTAIWFVIIYLSEIQTGTMVHRRGMSVRESASTYKVKRSTLSDKILRKHLKPYGRPTALSTDVENILAGVIDKLADWNFPVGPFEIKLMVKDLLDTRGEICTQFKDNTPGMYNLIIILLQLFNVDTYEQVKNTFVNR